MVQLIKSVMRYVRTLIRRLEGAPSDDLVAWLSETKYDNAKNTNFLSHFYNQKGSQLQKQNVTNAFLENVNDQINAGEFINISFDTDLGSWTGRIAAKEKRGAIGLLQVPTPSDFELENLSIKLLNIASYNVKVRIKSCDIAKLSVGRHEVDLVIQDTNIGTLEVPNKGLGRFEMKGGCLLNPLFPPPKSENPFTGNVSLHSTVFLPKIRDRYIIKDAQPYRNLRYHLRELENAQTANLIHSVELAMERKDDPWSNRFISRFYEWFSDFGASPIRPLLWLVLFYVISFYLTYKFKLAVLTRDNTDYVAWERMFLESDWSGELFRAAYLALQPISNPLGVFMKSPPLAPSSALLAAWFVVQGLLSVILIALSIFAVRRRFKMAS